MPFLGTRLAISALISENGFHLSSVDIFKCDQDHSMDASHFVDWVSRTCSLLRQEHGNIAFSLSATVKHLYENFRIFSQDFNNHRQCHMA
jgi:hypothetical protein